MSSAQESPRNQPGTSQIGSTRRRWSRQTIVALVSLISALISAASVIIAAHIGSRQGQIVVDQTDLAQIIARHGQTIEILRQEVRANSVALAEARSEVERLSKAPIRWNRVEETLSGDTSVQPTTTDHGFEFTSPVCNRTSLNAVTCEFAVTNLEPDRELSLYATGYPGSWLIDNFNNSFQANRVELTNKRGPEATALMVTEVKAKVVLAFEGVDPKAERVAKLTLSCRSGENFVKAFRDIMLR